MSECISWNSSFSQGCKLSMKHHYNVYFLGQWPYVISVSMLCMTFYSFAYPCYIQTLQSKVCETEFMCGGYILEMCLINYTFLTLLV